MFFPNLLNIKITLEIGPGAYPFWRSDCLADVYNESSEVDIRQFGGAKINTKGKTLFQIINNKLPFKDKSFDYIICSHVLEHAPVSNLQVLLSEIMRVGKKAYIEFPRPMYDYVYNLEVHLNFMDIVDGTIVCIDKKNTELSKFKMFHNYAFLLREKNLFVIDKYFEPVIAVGKEFSDTIPIKIFESPDEFFTSVANNITLVKRPTLIWKIKNKLHPLRITKYLFGEHLYSDYQDIFLDLSLK